jgi:hypothetical protein
MYDANSTTSGKVDRVVSLLLTSFGIRMTVYGVVNLDTIGAAEYDGNHHIRSLLGRS